MPMDFSDLEDDVVDGKFQPATKKSRAEFARTKFTCESCGGSGRWSGGVNRNGNAKCNACHGQGYFVTDPATRRKQRAQAAARKASKAQDAQDANLEQGNGFLHQWLLSVAGWNSFAASMIEQHNAGRVWSDKQVEACRRMYAKMAAKDAERAAATAARAVAVDLTAIAAMFDTALASGYKKPMYRAEGIRIKPGKGTALYVLSEERTEYGQFGEQPGYEGKITEGAFHPSRAALPSTAEALQAIAVDPLQAALRYGQRTGRCACCGRELTKHTSIDRGIGPICAEKWGLL